MSFLFILEQKFWAEKSLLCDRIKNEFFIINLATVPEEGMRKIGIHKAFRQEKR